MSAAASSAANVPAPQDVAGLAGSGRKLLVRTRLLLFLQAWLDKRDAQVQRYAFAWQTPDGHDTTQCA
jgi:hypothetical protein